MWSLVGLGVATVVAGMLGWAIGRRILLPLHKVTGAARRASQERLDERIRLDGPDDELKELADTFDDMLNRLDLAFASQRRFVANASHELRTPLTSMRTLIDVAMAKPTRTTEQLETLVGRVREALDQSEAIIDGLLTLARSDRGLTTRELAGPRSSRARRNRPDQHRRQSLQHRHRSRPVSRSHPRRSGARRAPRRQPAWTTPSATTSTGGSIHVETGTDHDQSYLSVTNTGPLVPQSKVASLFEPFTRLDQRVTNGHGVGLGLSIVASVVTAHNGHLEADALPNGGLKISARIPKTTVGTSADDAGQP